jgi:hypothetical protein
MITRLRSGAISMAIISRRSASLMAARTFALPTLARSAIRATDRIHFPVAAASFSYDREYGHRIGVQKFTY